MTKCCFKCKQEKDLSFFYFHKSGKQKGQALHICKLCANERANVWNKKNVVRQAPIKKRWYEKNRVRHNASVYAWRKRPGAAQENYHLAHNLRVRVRQVLAGNSKSDSTLRLIGCTIGQLKVHLENKFLPGMTWENYGGWEMDHIRPCASFDLRDPEQQKSCFHYTNLQPLWKVENQQKGAKIIA